jgi:hypothetical protein
LPIPTVITVPHQNAVYQLERDGASNEDALANWNNPTSKVRILNLVPMATL